MVPTEANNLFGAIKLNNIALEDAPRSNGKQLMLDCLTPQTPAFLTF
jgi:hypothetical protein